MPRPKPPISRRIPPNPRSTEFRPAPSKPSYAELETTLEGFQRAKILQPFIKDFLESIGVILCNMPFEEWPQIAKAAFRHNERLAPSAAALYKEGLPKNPQG